MIFWIDEETGAYFGLEENPNGRFIIEESPLQYIDVTGVFTTASTSTVMTTDDNALKTADHHVMEKSDDIEAHVSDNSPQAVEEPNE